MKMCMFSASDAAIATAVGPRIRAIVRDVDCACVIGRMIAWAAQLAQTSLILFKAKVR